MIRTLSLVAATLIITSTAAFATTYSIQVTNYCDHLTVTSSSGVVTGASDGTFSGGTACDQSYIIGTQKGKAMAAYGDLGLSPDSWQWTFKFGKKGTGTATLSAYLGSYIAPIGFDITYTTSGIRTPPVGRKLPSAISVFSHNK
jgi:hypothetical protein